MAVRYVVVCDWWWLGASVEASFVVVLKLVCRTSFAWRLFVTSPYVVRGGSENAQGVDVAGEDARDVAG